MRIRSPAFTHHGQIPSDYTCEGLGVSPPLEWDDVPEGTRSLALVVDDPDAPDPEHPRHTFVHWVLYNIPPDAGKLPEGVSREDLPAGTLEGTNDWKKRSWGGPCPPVGEHRFFFKLYALDVVLPEMLRPTKRDLEIAMHDHILAEARLVGLYQMQGRVRRHA